MKKNTNQFILTRVKFKFSTFSFLFEGEHFCSQDDFNDLENGKEKAILRVLFVWP